MEWLKKLAQVVLGNFYGTPSQPVKNATRQTVNFPKTTDPRPYPGTAVEHTGNRVANSTRSAQNLEDLAGKHFSNLNNTDGSVTKALNNYAKELYGKSLDELNEQQYRAVCKAARSYVTQGGTNSPANQLNEHYTIIINKFGNNK